MTFASRDEGRGIPADKLEAIFEPFEQVDSSDAREKGGTGLGLAISRGIVERHGGRIWAESGAGRRHHRALHRPPVRRHVPARRRRSRQTRTSTTRRSTAHGRCDLRRRRGPVAAGTRQCRMEPGERPRARRRPASRSAYTVTIETHRRRRGAGRATFYGALPRDLRPTWPPGRSPGTSSTSDEFMEEMFDERIDKYLAWDDDGRGRRRCARSPTTSRPSRGSARSTSPTTTRSTRPAAPSTTSGSSSSRHEHRREPLFLDLIAQRHRDPRRRAGRCAPTTSAPTTTRCSGWPTRSPPCSQESADIERPDARHPDLLRRRRRRVRARCPKCATRPRRSPRLEG